MSLNYTNTCTSSTFMRLYFVIFFTSSDALLQKIKGEKTCACHEGMESCIGYPHYIHANVDVPNLQTLTESAHENNGIYST